MIKDVPLDPGLQYAAQNPPCAPIAKIPFDNPTNITNEMEVKKML
jgi:hypothetical protein